jgi:hypothetical protein
MNKKNVLVLAALALPACGSGVSGKYGGDNCLWELDFRDETTVYVSIFGMEQPATYKVDGDKVSVQMPNGGVVFTRNGDTLEAGLMGEKMECKKL